jgi:hypothetical protein
MRVFASIFSILISIGVIFLVIYATDVANPSAQWRTDLNYQNLVKVAGMCVCCATVSAIGHWSLWSRAPISNTVLQCLCALTVYFFAAGFAAPFFLVVVLSLVALKDRFRKAR